jgi:ribosomal protein S18 acetylase RimI-like enzyme
LGQRRKDRKKFDQNVTNLIELGFIEKIKLLMKIVRKIEFDIEPDAHKQIIELRNLCFPDNHKNRSYYKQLPHFRYLTYDNDFLIGHMGVDHRVISVGDSIFKIFGVIDLCVLPNYRGQGIATQLLTLLSTLAEEKAIDFLLLVADSDKLYTKNGFSYISSYCSFLRIHEHKNYGVALEKIDNDFMIKPIGTKTWNQSELMDLLGYRF